MDGSVGEPVGPTGLRGRASECALLDDLVAAIRRSESRSLVLRGDAGIGKTALLDHLAASASGLTVIRAVGVQSEMELDYAALHQLCGPLLDGLERLPAPQRQAVETVFGMSEGAAPDRFLVGLAVLSLFAAVGEQRPLVCVVDDAQWLDQSSAMTLAFVARRLLAEPVGIVFAAREPGAELRHLPEMEVRGIGDGDARVLLSSAVRVKLDERVRDRIIAETRGNPLALLELPHGLSATQMEGGFGLLDARALTGRIEESFVRRLEALSDDARRLLLVAAAEPLGDPLLLWRAAERLSIGPAAADAAEEAGLLTIGERVTFRHPLVRSAVYAAAEAADRRAVHRSLAEATDRARDPDRRAWHLAAAAAGPDEDVARELERSAVRAQARGGLAAAAAFLQRSAGLTADPARRAQRALAAAEASVQAGAFEVARGLLATAEVGPLDELQQARVELLRGSMAMLLSFGSDAPPLLLKAAQRLEQLDARLARDTYLDAWGAAIFAGRLGTRGSLLQISQAARSAPRPEGAPLPSDLLLDGLAALITEGRAEAAGLLEEAVRTSAGEEFPAEASLRWGWLTAIPTYVLWDEDSANAIFVRQVQAVREAGALSRLPVDLIALGVLAVRCGDFAAAAEATAEAEALREVTGGGLPRYSAMLLAAHRGREAETCAVIESVRDEASPQGQGAAIQFSEWAFAVLCNGLGRYQEALASAQFACNENTDEFVISAFAAPELLEAATRSDNEAVAHVALEHIVDATAFARTDSARGILARSRALMSQGAAADELYVEAIDCLRRSRLRPELARAHLLYGEWLRREGRRLDAREQLSAAYEMLDAIGMEAFAERARKELQATGAKARKRTDDTRDDLTAQERQIARLARDGLSNPEIGARLFLSPRTVEWHLRKVFIKLGIHSRRELGNALRGSDSELVPA